MHIQEMKIVYDQILNSSTIEYPQLISMQCDIHKYVTYQNALSSISQYYFQFQKLLFRLNNNLTRFTGSPDTLRFIYNYGLSLAQYLYQSPEPLVKFHTIKSTDFQKSYFKQIFAMCYTQCWMERLEIIRTEFNDDEFANFINIYNTIHSAGTILYPSASKRNDSMYFFDKVIIRNSRDIIRSVMQGGRGELHMTSPETIINQIKSKLTERQNTTCDILYDVTVKTIGTFLLTDFKYTELHGILSRKDIKQLITCESIPLSAITTRFVEKFREGLLQDIISASNDMHKEIYALRYAQLSCNSKLFLYTHPEVVRRISQAYAIGHIYFQLKHTPRSDNSIIAQELHIQYSKTHNRDIYIDIRIDDYGIIMEANLKEFMMIFDEINKRQPHDFNLNIMIVCLYCEEEGLNINIHNFLRLVNNDSLFQQYINDAQKILEQYQSTPLATLISLMRQSPFAPLTIPQMLVAPDDTPYLADQILAGEGALRHRP